MIWYDPQRQVVVNIEREGYYWHTKWILPWRVWWKP